MKIINTESSMPMKNIKPILLLVFCLTLLLAAGCGTQETKYNPDSTVSITLSSEPSTLDPAMTYGLHESNVELMLFEGLTRLDENSVAQPALAESWDISADMLTYTFHLRPGIQWSDGTPITAQDFVYSWLRSLDPQTGCGNAYMLFDLLNAEAYNSEEADASQVGVKALDDSTLQVTLREPAAYFLSLTAFHVFYPVPRQVVSEASDTWASNHNTIVGCGPFKIVKWAHASEIILEKNEKYWNSSAVISDCIKMPISESKSTRLTMLESHLTDLILDPPSADQNRLAEMGLYQIVPMLGTTYYIFNVSKPPFDNIEVRKAFSMAVTREALVSQVVRNGKQPAVTFIPPGMKSGGRDFAQDAGCLVTEDPVQAKKVLDESGYKGEPVTILYNTSEQNKAISEAIQAMWKDSLGVEAELTNQETKVFYDTREHGYYQVAIANWVADFDDPTNFLDVFTDKTNDAQYHNPAYNRLMKLAHKEINPARRLDYLHQAEKMLFDDCVMIPLFYTNQIVVANPKLKGYFCSPMGTIDLIKAYKEK